MHFTIQMAEKHRGMELNCDWCFSQCRYGWYQRFNISDEYPSNWVCTQCKESVEWEKL